MTNQLPFDMVLPVEVIRRWATEYKEAGYAPEALLEYVAWEAAHWGVMKASGNPVRVMHRTPQPVAAPPPKNCWLDDEPDLCPSPCVFEDPSEVIENCTFAKQVKCKTDCKYYRTAVQPEPEAPTDEELLRLAREWNSGFESIELHFAADYARAALVRWGNSQGILDSSPQPVPVSERLPGPEDCDAEGRSWWWRSDGVEEFWELTCVQDPISHNSKCAENVSYGPWLPAHALPNPEPNAQ